LINLFDFELIRKIIMRWRPAIDLKQIMQKLSVVKQTGKGKIPGKKKM